MPAQAVRRRRPRSSAEKHSCRSDGRRLPGVRRRSGLTTGLSSGKMACGRSTGQRRLARLQAGRRGQRPAALPQATTRLCKVSNRAGSGRVTLLVQMQGVLLHRNYGEHMDGTGLADCRARFRGQLRSPITHTGCNVQSLDPANPVGRLLAVRRAPHMHNGPLLVSNWQDLRTVAQNACTRCQPLTS